MGTLTGFFAVYGEIPSDNYYIQGYMTLGIGAVTDPGGNATVVILASARRVTSMTDSQFIVLVRRAAKTGSVTDARSALEIARREAISYEDFVEFRSTTSKHKDVSAILDSILDHVGP